MGQCASFCKKNENLHAALDLQVWGQASLHDCGDAATLGWGANTAIQSNTVRQSDKR